MILLGIIAGLFMLFLIYAPQLLSLSQPPFEYIQDMRLTRNPYTATPTVTLTKQPSLTPTNTITPTPTGTLPKPSKTPTVLTATFTQTSTATRPAIELAAKRSDNFYLWRERLTDTWLWRHLYALFVGVGLASWLAMLYVRDVYGLRRSIRSAGWLRRIIFLLPLGTLHVKGGNLVDEQGRIVGPEWILVNQQGKVIRKNDQPVMAEGIRRTLRLLRVGIPARLIVDNNSCAVIEGRRKQAIVCGPTAGAVLLLGFSRLRRMVDLRDAVATLNLQQPTSDGILLSAEGVELVFSVYRGAQGTTFHYDEQAIFELVYRYWLEGDWLPAMTDRIAAELRQFIRSNSINKFLPYFTATEGLPLNRNQETNPFYEFVNQFNEHARQRGIQLRWLGHGNWRLVTEVELKNELDNWRRGIDQLLTLPEQLNHQPACAENNQALLDLIRQVPLASIDRLIPTEESISDLSNLRKIIRAYRDKLLEVLQCYQQHGQAPPAELVAAINQLSQLLNRKIGGSG